MDFHGCVLTSSGQLTLLQLSQLDTMAQIYQTNVRQKTGRTITSTQNPAFINMHVNVGYDQISRQVSTRVRNFESS